MTITTPRNATATPIAELLENRWSPRGFDSTHTVSDEELNSLVEAARWSPSAFNKQPWGFIAGRRGTDTFTKILDAMAPFNRMWNENVSAVFVAFAQVESEGEPIVNAHYDLGQAAAHLTFQAESLGMQAHQMTGFDVAAIAAAFDVPAGFEPYTLIAVGQHASNDSVPEQIRERDAAPRMRKELDQVLFIAE